MILQISNISVTISRNLLYFNFTKVVKIDNALANYVMKPLESTYL